MTVPDGCRLLIAIDKALVTSVAVWAASIDQPTTLRENVSSTTAQYTLPSRVGCSVISVTHNRFGAARAKSRLTRSSGVGVSRLGRGRRLPGRPLIPARRINNSTA